VPQRLGFLTDAVDVGPVTRRQILGANQAAVAVNRRQPVAELVGDAGGELAHARQRFLQPQLLLELDDRREVREQADRPFAAVGGRRQAKHGKDQHHHDGHDHRHEDEPEGAVLCHR